MHDTETKPIINIKSIADLSAFTERLNGFGEEAAQYSGGASF